MVERNALVIKKMYHLFNMKTTIPTLAFLVAALCSCTNNSSESNSLNDSTSQHIDNIDTTDIHADNVEAGSYMVGVKLLQEESIGGLKIGLVATKVKELLGTPEETSPAEVWEADGETHQFWNYPKQGVSLEMIGKEEPLINGITISPPYALKTTKSVGIGSSNEEVLNKYKAFLDKNNTDDNMIVAGDLGAGIIFSFDKGIVTSIFFGSAGE